MELVREKLIGAGNDLRGEKPKENNFPPFVPFMRISITEDCEPEKKYLGFLALIFCLLTYVMVLGNSIVACVTMVGTIVLSKDYLFVYLFIASAIHILVGAFGIFIFQFLPVYHACRPANSLRYLIAFVTQFFWVIYFIVMCLGIPHIGSSGLLTGLIHIKWVKQQWWILILNVVFALAWIFFAAGAAVILALLIMHFRKDNSSLFEAKSQIFAWFAKRRLGSSI